MPQLDNNGRIFMADKAGELCTGTLRILVGSTVLAEHTVGPYAAGATGVRVDNDVADATILDSGRADSCTVTNASNEVTTLSIGIVGSGAEVIVAQKGAEPAATDLDYVQGGTSTINSVTITYPAS